MTVGMKMNENKIPRNTRDFLPSFPTFVQAYQYYSTSITFTLHAIMHYISSDLLFFFSYFSFLISTEVILPPPCKHTYTVPSAYPTSSPHLVHPSLSRSFHFLHISVVSTLSVFLYHNSTAYIRSLFILFAHPYNYITVLFYGA